MYKTVYFYTQTSDMGLVQSWTDEYIEAGCDEVGRGCLCGPVVAAAVILDKKTDARLINDSKKLIAKNRLQLDDYIKSVALDFAIAELPPSYIDSHNILNASIHAMHLALNQLKTRPELILVDGNKFHPYPFTPHICVIKGDAKVLSIAAASILAKNYRDQKMMVLHEEFPQYGWDKNMGYATKQHREALKLLGPTPHHRRSFRLNYD